MNPLQERIQILTRRHFFGRSALGLGTAPVASLFPGQAQAATATGGLGDLPHFAPKAKRAIYLFMNEGPSQMDLFDYKPKMAEWFDKDLPESIRKGQRLTTMTSGQARFPIAPTVFKFQQYGQSGAWLSELLLCSAKRADNLTIIRTVNTEAINHEPAITFIQTGNQIPGKPCIGSW